MSRTSESQSNQETLAEMPEVCAIVFPALLDFLRATRRAKLAEVAALEKLERVLIISRASQHSKS